MEQYIPQYVRYIMAVVLGGLGLVMLFWRTGPNLWMGVRLPWTMADRQIWDKSWRLAAIFLTGMGVWALLYWRLFFVALAHFVVLAILYPIFLYWRKYHTLRFWKDVGWVEYHPVVRCRSCGHWQKLPNAEALAAARCEECEMPFQEKASPPQKRVQP